MPSVEMLAATEVAAATVAECGSRENRRGACEDAILATGIVRRSQILDGLVSIERLRKDPSWEKDFALDCWVRRSPEFFAARNAAMAALVQQQADAEIALARAIIDLEQRLPPQRDGVKRAIAETGQPYVTVVSGRVGRWEGEVLPGYATSAEAILTWRTALLGYAAENPGDTLWWRIRPEIDGRVRFGDSASSWVVYCRLLIGNQADTLIERLRRGDTAPTQHMLTDGSITERDLAALGYSKEIDPGTGLFRRMAA